MTSVRSSSPSRRWLGHGLAWVAGVCALGAASVAQARDLNWSIGIDSPGVSVGVSNHRPVVVYPQPVYGAPVYGAPVYGRPVYAHPQPVYQVRPVPGYVQPVVVHPYPPVVVYGQPHHGQKNKHRHGHRHGHDRWERDDDHRRWR